MTACAPDTREAIFTSPEDVSKAFKKQGAKLFTKILAEANKVLGADEAPDSRVKSAEKN